MKQKIKYPAKVLQPIKNYLKEREKKILKRKKGISDEDPFADGERLQNNIATDAGAAKKNHHERSVAVKGELDKTLVRIRKALTMIKIGKYGLCDECGNMIDTDRLSIDPASLVCVSCAKKKSPA